MNLKSLVVFLNLFVSFLGFSQTLNPVKWQAQYSDLPNNEGEITVTATIDKNWHIYSQKATDAGPIPTSFVFSPAKDFQLMGKPLEENAKEEYVKAFEAKVFVFEGKAVFKQKIKRTNLKAFSSVVKLEYMTCNDMQCLPPKNVELSISAPALTVKK